MTASTKTRTVSACRCCLPWPKPWACPLPDLRAALESDTYAPKVRKDFLGGVRSDVNGTPTFFINGMRHDRKLCVR